MTNPRVNQVENTPLEAALAWHACIQDQLASAETWHAFTMWLEADTSHRQAFDLVEDLHAEIDEGASQLRRLIPPDANQPTSGMRALTARPKLLPWLAGAALGGCAALLVVLSLPTRPSFSIQTAAYEAPPGKVRTFTLADGSHIDLSPGSRLAIRLDDHSRQLTLDRGEAAFTIGHDPRPLILHAADVQVRDIGTVFDIAMRNPQVTVTVVSGLVAVSSGTSANAVTLTAGQQFVHAGGSAPDRVVASDTKAVLSWRTGFQTYRDVALSDIVADLDRDFATHITVSDASTGARRFSGVLKVDTMEATLSRLAALLDLSIVRHGDAVELAGPDTHP